MSDTSTEAPAATVIPARDVAALAALLEAEGDAEIKEADPRTATFESLLGYGDGLKHAAERLRELAEAVPPESGNRTAGAGAVEAERDRIRAGAEALKFTLFKPGNGPAQTQALDVVPLEGLLGVLDGAAGG